MRTTLNLPEAKFIDTIRQLRSLASQCKRRERKSSKLTHTRSLRINRRAGFFSITKFISMKNESEIKKYKKKEFDVT
jgi:hypothetical protein